VSWHVESPARPGQPGGRTGRPRSETAERAIIEATLDVIAADGVAAVSIEGVAAKAGVGKTTIYRRWPNKKAMLANRMTERSGRVHACLMFEAHRHPELAKLYRETVIEPRRELVRNILRRGVKSGELRADLDINLMLSLVTAPLLYRTSPIGQLDPEPAGDLAETIVDSVLGGLQPR